MRIFRTWIWAHPLKHFILTSKIAKKKREREESQTNSVANMVESSTYEGSWPRNDYRVILGKKKNRNIKNLE